MVFLQLTITKVQTDTTTTTHELILLALHVDVASMITVNALNHSFPFVMEGKTRLELAFVGFADPAVTNSGALPQFFGRP